MAIVRKYKIKRLSGGSKTHKSKKHSQYANKRHSRPHLSKKKPASKKPASKKPASKKRANKKVVKKKSWLDELLSGGSINNIQLNNLSSTSDAFI